jgi:hypothetical protein
MAGRKKLSPEALAREAAADRLAVARAMRAAVKKRGRDPSQINDFALELLAENEECLKFEGVYIPDPGPKIALIEIRDRMFLECCENFRGNATGVLDRKRAYDAFVNRRTNYNKNVPKDEQLPEPKNKEDIRKESSTLFHMREKVARGGKPYPLERRLVSLIHTLSHASTLADVADYLRGAPDRQREHAEFVARWNESHRADIEAGNLTAMSDEFDELNP